MPGVLGRSRSKRFPCPGAVLINQAGAERAGCVGSLHRRGSGQGCAVFIKLLSGAVAHENRALPSPFLKDAECSVRGSQVGSAQARCQGRKGKPAFSHTWGGRASSAAL